VSSGLSFGGGYPSVLAIELASVWLRRIYPSAGDREQRTILRRRLSFGAGDRAGFGVSFGSIARSVTRRISIKN
jgi:hypothetical protein